MSTSFPLWQADQSEYEAICAYLGLSPNLHLFDRLSSYLAEAPFRFAPPQGFSGYLADMRLTPFRIARLDLVTKMFFPGNPFRHVVNAVLALHECEARGYREMATQPAGWALVRRAFVWGLESILTIGVTAPWLGWQAMTYAMRLPFRASADLKGKRVLITGVSRGLGSDLMLACLERGAEVIGIVRNLESSERVNERLPSAAPLKLIRADLATPGALVGALRESQIRPETIDIAILCAGVKHDGKSVLAVPSLRDTFEVNCFSAAEFANWLCTPAAEIGGPGIERERVASAAPPITETTLATHGKNARPDRALVLVSSIGRWHGMHGTCGYNASKAALSIWGESLDMELRRRGDGRFTVTIVEPGMFESGMTRATALTKILVMPRSEVARRILSGTLAGRKSIRPPLWFALLTWGLCMSGRELRYRLFARAKPVEDR